MRLVNLTPHAITILPTEGGDEAEPLVIEPSGLARLPEEQTPLGAVDCGRWQVPLVGMRYSAAEGLPEPEPNVLLVVSQMVAAAHPERADLVYPVRFVRDDAGVIVGCTALARANGV